MLGIRRRSRLCVQFFIAAMAASGAAKSCMASAPCFQRYVNQVWELLGKVEALNWVAEHDRVAAQIAPYVAMDTRRHYTDADVAHGQSDMGFFVSERRTHITSLIPPATP